MSWGGLMHKFTLALGLFVGLALLAGPAAADDWTLANMGTKLGTGLNGIVTSPADIVMATMDGSSMTQITGVTNLVGLVVGTVEGVVRAVAGATDALTCIVPEVGMVSPKPRYAVIPGTKM